MGMLQVAVLPPQRCDSVSAQNEGKAGGNNVNNSTEKPNTNRASELVRD